MEHFWNIIKLPDNIPIVLMLLLLAWCMAYAVYEMIQNDKLIKSGQKDKVYDRMIR
jgi:hypothetical protein